jgi:hypothetical protein
VIGLVPLACVARVDVHLNCGPRIEKVEVRAEVVEGFLDALMPRLMCAGQDLGLA